MTAKNCRDTNNDGNFRNGGDVNHNRKANNNMYAKIEGTPATVEKPTAEGTTTSMETAGTEGMSTTAGPQQQQKRQPQHECEARQHKKRSQQRWKNTRNRMNNNNSRTPETTRNSRDGSQRRDANHRSIAGHRHQGTARLSTGKNAEFAFSGIPTSRPVRYRWSRISPSLPSYEQKGHNKWWCGRVCLDCHYL
jgi:hypothetical protein